ncbi:MAG: Ig-like domain-containing protein [Oscillospiraceae bacterium]|nr:Ig-like domain-containing protein [Oscillospiraceae bacterium]
MSKIICDVCGTRYPESAEQCPICGCIRAAGAKTAADAIVMEEAQVPEYNKVRGGRFSKKNVRKRNKKMVRYEMQAQKGKPKAAEEMPDEYEEMEPRKRSNAVLNVLLVIVIIALLLVSGYIAKEYFLPNFLASRATEAPTETEEPTEPPTEEPTEEPTVPCTGLELVNGSTELVLTEAGQMALLNVKAMPEDTTDLLTYASSDEAVVTVDEQGAVTAVGDGEAVITVTCGAETMEFNVICFFIEETEEPTEAPTEEPTEEPTEPLKNVTLAVDKTDMTFTMIGQTYTLKIKNGLTAQEITWVSENEDIVTIDENGVITCKGWGRTNIIAKYGDQEITIICRCRKN